MRIRLADYVANFLVEHGVTDVFSVVGGGAMHLNDALGQSQQEEDPRDADHDDDPHPKLCEQSCHIQNEDRRKDGKRQAFFKFLLEQPAVADRMREQCQTNQYK